jgi:hypothetical protein
MTEPNTPTKNTNVLVAVTSLFNEHRLAYLAQTLRTLSLWDVAYMRIVVLTNDAGQLNNTRLRRLCEESCSTRVFEIRVISDLDNTWRLTWSHKNIIRSEFVPEESGFSHFIYLEDDIELQDANFLYWLRSREALRSKNLIPSFLRLEYERLQAAWTASDAFWPVFIPCQSYVCLDELCWVSMPNPYNPMFIMDRELAQEYVLTRSFDELESSKVCDWGLAERAAMGLCNENVPDGFPHRYVVPVTKSGWPLNSCQIFHIPSNYAGNPRHPLGRVRIGELLAGINILKPKVELESETFLDPSRDLEGLTSLRSVSWGGCRAPETRTSAIGDWTDAVNLPVVSPEIGNGFIVVTHHDTILFYDFEACCLRQEPFGIAPINLIVSFTGERARLFAIDSDNKVNYVAFGGAVHVRDDNMCEIDRMFYIDNTFSLSKYGKYLSANMNGEINWHVDLCREWERFKTMRVDTIVGMAWLRREDWIGENGEIVSWHDQPFDFGRERTWEASALAATIDKDALASRRAFKFFGSRIFLTTVHHQAFVLSRGCDSEPPTDLIIIDPDGSHARYNRVI